MEERRNETRNKKIKLEYYVVEYIEDIIGILNAGGLEEEQQIAYNYILRRFVENLLEDRYTII